MNLPEDFIFSQSSLQDYVDCARRFELKYLLKQRYPAPEVDDMLTYERRSEQGENFHRLVHQHLIGIPPEILARHIDDPQVARWFETYLARGLEGLPPRHFPELTLTIVLDDYLLMAKFDLVALNPPEEASHAVIVDWKTGEHIPNKERMQKRLQSIVYRYVLAQGGDHLNGGRAIAPDVITMRYWYADHDGEMQVFPYDAALMREDEAYLAGLMREIDTRETFPLTTDERQCRYCQYRSLCDRGVKAGALDDWDHDIEPDGDDFTISLDQIAEIAF